MTDDEWGGIAERIASTWPTDAGDPARYRDELDHLDPAAVEAALDDMLIEYRTEAPPPGAVRARAEAVPAAEVAPFEPAGGGEGPAAQEPAAPAPRGRTPEPGPERESARATVALILGVAGLVTLPLVVSVAAIVVARSALAEIAADPGLGGERRARTGMLLGWIGLGILALTIVVGVIVGLTD